MNVDQALFRAQHGVEGANTDTLYGISEGYRLDGQDQTAQSFR